MGGAVQQLAACRWLCHIGNQKFKSGQWLFTNCTWYVIPDLKQHGEPRESLQQEAGLEGRHGFNIGEDYGNNSNKELDVCY